MGQSLSLDSAVEIISQWQSKPSDVLIFKSGRHEISKYIEAVDTLQRSGSNDELISAAMTRLRAEFEAVLSQQANHQAGPISITEYSSVSDSTAYALRYEDYVSPEPPSDDVIAYLKIIAQRMNASEGIGECVEVYKSVRKSFLEAQLQPLRFNQLKHDCNPRRYSPDELKLKTESWIQLSKICVKILFEREKKLCSQIFENLGINGAARDECFVLTVKEFALGLFGFAGALSLSKQPYERMGDVLGVYDTFLRVRPSAEALFVSDHGKEIRDIIAKTLSTIEDDVGRMMYDLQSAVSNEIWDVLDERGGVHRTTEHVMEQINVIVRDKDLLTRLIKSAPSLDLLGDHTYNRSSLELHLISIIEVLHKNLETKSKRYQDSSLAQVFMMNNVCYILRKIEISDKLKQMIGDRFLTKLNDSLKSAMTCYRTTTCKRLLNCFDQDRGLHITPCFKSRPSKTAMRKRLNAFNALFEQIMAAHASWTIPDSELRDDVRISVTEILVPAYKNFLEGFGSNPEPNLMLERSIKHSVEDLEALVLKNLFADHL